ncbi:MAG: non-reducing end alpha-L-arabinofuranosidase family hydrolase [Catenulispora sp.]
MRISIHRSWLSVGAAAALAAAAAGLTATGPAHAAVGCRVDYSITSQWQGGFGASVHITNLGSATTSWTLGWTFGAGQTITQMWAGVPTQSGADVTVANAPYNGAIPSGGSTYFGFNGAWTSGNPVPAAFTLNGTVCTGAVSTSPTPTYTSEPPTTPSMPASNLFPYKLAWNSTGILINPKSDARHSIISVKDPSVVNYNGRWYVYMSTVDSGGNYGMAAIDFADWSQADSAPLHYLDQTAIGGGYKTAPMLFYFAPQKLWYLTYQTGSNMSYSTNPDITNPAGWSASHDFYSNGMPSLIKQNIGSGYWVDSWVICDSANCHLFSADDNGHIYNSTSSLSQFPNGFGDGSNTVIAAEMPNKYDMFEADNVYKVVNSPSDNTYVMVVEAIGSDGHRRFNAWTANGLAGQWYPLAADPARPFLAASNVTFPPGTPAWTQDFSSGEAIRGTFDQTAGINSCHLQYLYQGMAPGSNQSYNLLPWRIGLATLTNPVC